MKTTLKTIETKNTTAGTITLSVTSQNRKNWAVESGSKILYYGFSEKKARSIFDSFLEVVSFDSIPEVEVEVEDDVFNDSNVVFNNDGSPDPLSVLFV